MKSKRGLTGNIIIVMVLSCFGLSGCTWTIVTAKQAPLQTGSALKLVKPLKVCIKDFQDMRGMQKDVVHYNFKLDKPIATWVHDTIQREFERNGHTCLKPDKEGEADIVVEGLVYRYSIDFQVGIYMSKMVSNVGVKMSIKAVRDPNHVFTKKYDGNSFVNSMSMPLETVSEGQNEALLNMVKDFTTDQELLDFLHLVNRNSY
jgi:hypothetical protein